MRPLLAGWAAAVFTLGFQACGRAPSVPALTEEFVYTTLAFSPAAATAAGLHDSKGLHLDGLLDDVSPESMAGRLKFYREFSGRLGQVDSTKLAPQEKADFAILQDRAGLALLEYGEEQPWLHNPATYTETLGTALYAPYAFDYAPKTARFSDIVSRLRAVPLFLSQAASNLSRVPAVWCAAAMEELQGVIDLADGELRAAAPEELKSQYESAASMALPALRKFQDLLTNKLQYVDNYDWRLGSGLYGRKFRLALESAGSAQDTLQAAEQEFVAARARMYELALPFYVKLPGARKDLEKLEPYPRQYLVIGAVLADIARRRPTAGPYLDEARKAVNEARELAEKSGLFPASVGAVETAATPAFQRVVVPAVGLYAAPPLDPQAPALFWITPAARGTVGGYYGDRLHLLAMQWVTPGRFLQSRLAAGVEPKPQRLLRTVFGDEGFEQGWAEYATEQIVEAEHSPEVALALAKEQLRIILNAALDVRLHTLQMTDSDALDALRDGAFQAPEEAAANLRLLKLDSCRAPAAFVGLAKWLGARAEYQAAGGGGAAEFHAKALRQGAVPMSQLVNVLTH
jgi:uncharacterized protein (DUF885 family)